jgi:hypothetical protein
METRNEAKRQEGRETGETRRQHKEIKRQDDNKTTRQQDKMTGDKETTF